MTEEEYQNNHRREYYPWMSDDQWECFMMLSELHYGWHHIIGKVKPFGTGIENNTYATRWATFDYDGLTRAVLMSHERMIRFEIGSSGPGRIRLILHKRHTREGSMSKRHPNIITAIKKFKGIKS